jgi:hypothetical protein
MAREKSAWNELKNRSAALRARLQGLGRDLDSIVSAETIDAVRGAELVEAEAKSWNDLVDALLPRVSDHLARLRRLRDEQIETFDERLSRALRDQGHEVYGETALLIVDGIVHVETNPKKAVVKVNGMIVEDLLPLAICERVKVEADRLRKLVTAPEKMLDELLIAYERELHTTGREPGAQANASAVLLQVAVLRQRPAFGQNPTATNFREYPRELFRADLHALLVSGQQVVRGKRFRSASGSDTSGAIFMLVPALGRAAHVGRIWFETAE